MQNDEPDARNVIDKGLTKLREYEDRVFENSTYTVATNESKKQIAKAMFLAEARKCQAQGEAGSGAANTKFHQSAPIDSAAQAREAAHNILGLKPKRSTTAITQTLESEVERYLHEPTSSLDILVFWMLVLKFSKKGGFELNFMEEYNEDVETKELENLHANDLTAPEEIHAFSQFLRYEEELFQCDRALWTTATCNTRGSSASNSTNTVGNKFISFCM
ncbi:hypothetical protein BC629DRAFT_1598283 [Irpex lacteus]|nr:hypothetical protein BC629DRAFT_1598283 [Irpex lacteus]